MVHWLFFPQVLNSRYLMTSVLGYMHRTAQNARPHLLPDTLQVFKGWQQPPSLPGDDVKLQGYTRVLSRVPFTFTVGMRDLKHQVMFGTTALECLFFNEFILGSYFWGKKKNKKTFCFMLVFVLLLRCDQSKSWPCNHLMHFGCSFSLLWNLSLFSCLWQPNFTSR